MTTLAVKMMTAIPVRYGPSFEHQPTERQYFQRFLPFYLNSWAAGIPVATVNA
jgi:hypothetical protein